MRLQQYIKEAVSKGYNYQLVTPAIKKLKPVKKNSTHERAFINKPDNGFWTSTLKGKNKSAWTEWAEAEDFDDVSSGTILEIQKGVSMYIIDNVKHFKKLLEKFPYEVSGMGVISIDFVKFSKTYDALYLTEAGARKNHMGSGSSLGLNAWDMESTVWFNTKYLKIIRNV